MARKKFEVIAPHDHTGRPSYWDGEKLVAAGTIVEIDTDVVKVSPNSKALKAVEDAKPDAKK